MYYDSSHSKGQTHLSLLFLGTKFVCIFSVSDPFFLDDDESEVNTATKESAVLPEKLDSGMFPKIDKRSVTDGKGPSPRTDKKNEHVSDSDWEWDGTVDEEAHLGWD